MALPRIAPAVILAILLAPSRAAAGEPCTAEPTECGRVAFDAGVVATRTGDWQRAVDAFREALEYKPHPVITYNLAFAEAELGHALDAIAHFGEVVHNPQSSADLVQRATAERERAEGLVAAISVDPATGRDSKLEVDGKRALGSPPMARVDPGKHHVRLVSGGRALIDRAVDVKPGEKLTLTVSHQRELVGAEGSDPARVDREERDVESGGLSPTWFWVGASVTAGLAAATVWSGLDATSAHDDFVHDLPGLDRAQADERKQLGEDKQARTNVLLAATAVVGAVTGGLALFAVDWSGGRGAEVTVRPGGADVRGTF